MMDFLFNPHGRISRKGFLVAYLAPYLFLVYIVGPMFAGLGLSILQVLIGLFLLWPNLVAVPVKRFHDMGASGWYQAGIVGLQILAGIIIARGLSDAGVLPTAGDAGTFVEQQRLMVEQIGNAPHAQLGMVLWMLVGLAQTALFAFVRGVPGKNRYGDDPLQTESGFGT